jgi:hypothetical protein
VPICKFLLAESNFGILFRILKYFSHFRQAICDRQTTSYWTTFTVIIWRYIHTGPSASFDIFRLIIYPNFYYHAQNILSCTMTSGTWARSFSHFWFISEAFSISLPIIPTSFTCFFLSSIESIIYSFLISSWVLCSRIWYYLIVIMIIKLAIKCKIDGVRRC